ncbi:MAG: efflux transporter outer membrane subunit [Proteobacteria bacterium]|jgi:multidrug efflux system outer membrane protein|nr:transporter [Methylibium sp.]MBY0366191.1 efflux transporter outer membrane subunit [Burkholderiaceae bacterium]MCH8855423.1 efflux transporter outer membrane subunit [Pseudomonadota bacterium]|mmetsp:Transcript_6740/g.28258  ORF Transcript_6740/g.28258 Transcript_6740/m.28258 type:complete len:461 (-) Transcript_6740:2278-3660(-)
MRATARSRLLWALPALALAACAQHPVAPAAPPITPPAQWQHTGGSAAQRSDWWQGFGDATLTALITEALVSNHDLRLAAARVAEAHAMARVQHAAFWPSLDVVAAEMRSRSISDVKLAPYLSTGHQALFQAGYELDLWGRVADLASAADSSEAASAAARDAVALSVSASVAQSYIGLLELDAQIDLARRMLASRERSLALTRQRFEVGHASAVELAQAQIEMHGSAQALPQLARAVERQEAQLNLLLGRRPGPVERGGRLDALRPCAMPDAGLPSELLRRRPDLYSAELQLAASDAQLAAARKQWLPSLRLSASFGTVGSSVLRNGPFSIWSLGGSVLAPLFNGGRLQALAEGSAARREQALVTYERTVLAAWTEVETQLDAHLQQQTQLQQALDQRQSAAEALRLAGRRYREGYASQLDELLAQRSLLTVEQSVLQSQAGLLQNEVALFRALGGGWAAR